MWATVKEEAKKGKQNWRVGDLLTDDICSSVVLDFMRSTHVGRTAPPVGENWDSEGSEADPGRMERRRRRRTVWRSTVVARGLLGSGFLGAGSVFFPL